VKRMFLVLIVIISLVVGISFASSRLSLNEAVPFPEDI
jgi:hypothetical protein